MTKYRFKSVDAQPAADKVLSAKRNTRNALKTTMKNVALTALDSTPSDLDVLRLTLDSDNAAGTMIQAAKKLAAAARHRR